MSEQDKILIVEDEKDTRFILEKLLTKNSYEVASVLNGEEAIEKLKTFKPKVIIADWTMPILDGLQLCKILKDDDATKMIYYIILTARTSLKDRVTGLDIGADDFLIKPIENQELLARIRSGIRIYNLQTEIRSIEHSKAILEMSCTIGHQINNPLSSLLMTISSIKDEIREKKIDHLEDDFKIVSQSIQRIKSLVDDLIHLQNPTTIDYTSESKMIKLN
ncbi:MAG TPA: response regulator [Ignavibacteriaceae bacterium]|nr:response regulator [Ignavibacteriaceae bacterium]